MAYGTRFKVQSRTANYSKSGQWIVDSGQWIVSSGWCRVKWTLECVDAGMWEWELKRGQKYKYKLVLYLKL